MPTLRQTLFSNLIQQIDFCKEAFRIRLDLAPPADMVPGLMNDLLGWLQSTDVHPLIAGCVFHYELEFIHPFADGNGRIGRFWQTLILSQWKALLARFVSSIFFDCIIALFSSFLFNDLKFKQSNCVVAPFHTT